MKAPAPQAAPGARKRVVILGATGSIGDSALRVIAAHPTRLELAGIAGRGNWEKLAAIARRHQVREIAIHDEPAARAAAASGAFPAGARIRSGIRGLTELAQLPAADIVLVAVTGTTGLAPALAALEAGKDLALASKEILVLAGKFVMAAAAASGARLLPVDSEHNAVFQCLQGRSSDVRRIILTASGGAFRDWTPQQLARATVADALKHPNWTMGPKITVDSATMANKGLELIEAQWLFGLRPDQCQAILHPQSIVHCLVEFADGGMLAQLCPPSMTFPIQHALLHPERVPGPEAPLALERLFALEFRPVEESRYPLLRLARQAMEAGGAMPAVYNAANEVAVGAFLREEIPFLAISSVVEHTLSSTANFEPSGLEAVLTQDADARAAAAAALGAHLTRT